MLKERNLYYPEKEFKSKAWIKSATIYKKALKDPIKFWETLAEDLYWFSAFPKTESKKNLLDISQLATVKGKFSASTKWKRAFVHDPPYFQWFVGGKINITTNIFDRNKLTFGKIKNKPAIIWEPEPVEEQPRILTYGQLYAEVNKLANALKKIGVQKGDRVAIYLPVVPEVAISMLACARIGAVHSVVFSAFSANALKLRLQDTEAKVLITADGYFRRGQIVNLKANADEAVKETSVEKVIVVKRAKNEILWDEVKDVWLEDLVKEEEVLCKAEIMDSEDPFFILYTSGSTGKPKGVLHTCAGYAVQSKFTGKWIFDFKDNTIFWCTSDPGWITGHTYAVYSPLLNGITTLLFEGAPDWPTPDRWAQIIEKHKVTVFYTAPTAIRMFEKYGSDILKKYDFKTLRLLGSVGEPIDEAAWLWYFTEVGKERCPIVDTWWQTETGGILITSLPGLGPIRPAFTGLPFPGIKFDILDEKGASCPVEKQGNLVILAPFSPGMLRGIYKNEGKYLETYWNQYGKEIYFTSDGAYKDKDGLIRIVGRVDDVIKVAGHRVSTGELENAINLLPEISESAVVGIPDQIKGEVPVAFASYKGKENLEELKKKIVEQIKKQIGPIALPKSVFIVEDLPKTRSGKMMRRILKKLLTQEELGDLSTLSNPESVEKIQKMLAGQKGSLILLLDFLFIAVGIAVLIVAILQNKNIIKWLTDYL